jgi:hypothetical protein
MPVNKKQIKLVNAIAEHKDYDSALWVTVLFCDANNDVFWRSLLQLKNGDAPKDVCNRLSHLIDMIKERFPDATT